MVGVMGEKAKGMVKARTCKLGEAKKLMLCSRRRGEPLQVLENECDVIKALSWGHGIEEP